MALLCRLLGHRFRFTSEHEVMRWTCERDGCGAGGAKRYPSAEQAARFAGAFDVEDRRELGRRAPFGLLPLRLWHARLRRRSAAAKR